MSSQGRQGAWRRENKEQPETGKGAKIIKDKIGKERDRIEGRGGNERTEGMEERRGMKGTTGQREGKKGEG